jgi:hypothetical protein
MRRTIIRAIARPRAAIVAAYLALATALPGCGAPEGFASIDADAARQTLVAPMGQAKHRIKPQGLKRPAGLSVASRRR